MTEPDAILHLEHNWAGWLSRGYEGRVVLAIHFLVAEDLPRSTWYAMMARAAERRLLERQQVMTTVTSILTERVQAMAPQAEVVTVPLAFDTSLYEMPDALPAREPVVGLIGSFAWQPTTVAAQRLLDVLWPRIVKRVPTAKLLIVGRDARRVLRAHVNRPGVQILDYVADIAPYFHALDVLLYAPPRGSGMKVKVMEAFAFGTPVVTSTAGAEGIPIQDGTHAGLSDDDEGLVERTIDLLEDTARRERYRHAARQLIEHHSAPNLALDRLEGAYARCG
jgi:glycosyltransferase involved in cell wall biosynthesis